MVAVARFDLGAAFLTLEAAVRALENPAHGKHFLPALHGGLFFPGRFDFVVEGNDVCHWAPRRTAESPAFSWLEYIPPAPNAVNSYAGCRQPGFL
jgi:hypothetical protein